MLDTCAAMVRLSKQSKRQYKESNHFLKELQKEGAVDPMLSNEEKILANSRLSASNSYYMPMTTSCIIISAVHLAIQSSLMNLVFGWLWLGLAIVSFLKHKEDKKKIMEMTE